MAFPEERFEAFSERYAQALARIHSKYLRRIAERIREIGELKRVDFHRLARLREYGADFEAMKRELAALTDRTAGAIPALVAAAASESYGDLERLAEMTGRPLIPYAENAALQATADAIARQTAGTFRNLSNTSAIGYAVHDSAGAVVFRGAGEAYRDAVDRAIHEVTMGPTDPAAAIRQTLKDLADSGLRTVSYESGRTRRLDSAVRMNVLDGMRDVYQGIQDEYGARIGADGVELSAHGTCAPDHLPYQGGQYSLKAFDDLQARLERPFGMWNCRHSWHRILLGVSRPAYTAEELAELRRLSTERILFEGKEMTRYEATQLQRRIETGVRAAKDRANIAAAAGDDVWRRAEQLRINQLTAKYQELSDAAGLPTRRERMSVGRPPTRPALASVPSRGRGFGGFRPVRASDKKASGLMSRHEGSGDWFGITSRTHTPETFEYLKNEAAKRNILLRNIEKFDGNETMIESAIQSISDFYEEFPKINPKRRRLILDIGVNMGEDDLAEIEGFRIRINRYALYDPEILARNMAGNTSGRTIESLIRHELGHLIESAYHVSGLEAAKATLEQLQGTKPGEAETIQYLLKNVSRYSVKPTEFLAGEKVKILYNELIPEVLGGKGFIPEDFYQTFVKILHGKERSR